MANEKASDFSPNEPHNGSVIYSMMRVNPEEGLRMLLDTAEKTDDEELVEKVLRLSVRYFDIQDKIDQNILHEKYAETELKSVIEKIVDLLISFERTRAA